MVQHEDLGVLGHAVHLVDADRLCDATHELVEEGERHRGRASPSSSCLVKLPKRVNGPFTHALSTVTSHERSETASATAESTQPGTLRGFPISSDYGVW